MKKTILKILNKIAYYAGCAGVGYVLGKIATWLLERIGVDEGMVENHPWKAFFLIVAVCFILICIPAIPICTGLWYLSDKIDDKIDEMEDDPFEK